MSITSLTLTQAFEYAQNCNPSVRNAYWEVRMAKGEAITAFSRFLPQVSILFSDTAKAPTDSIWNRTNQLFLQIRQRLFEFGPMASNEIDRLKRKKNAVVGYENELVRINSDLRTTFFTLALLHQQQVQHDSLLALFEHKVAQAEGRLANGIIRKNEMLMAWEALLTEKESILGLRLEQRKARVHLKSLLGIASFDTSIELIAPDNHLSLNEDSCVARALALDGSLVIQRFEAEIARRQLFETAYSLVPKGSVTISTTDKENSGAISLSTQENEAWHLDAIGLRRIAATNAVGAPSPNLSYTIALGIEFPIFTGLERFGKFTTALAHYEQARAQLLFKTAQLEESVRSAWADYQTKQELNAILEKRMSIAFERYEMAEAEHVLGKILDNDFDQRRKDYFDQQSARMNAQMNLISAEENLRKLIRLLTEEY